MKSISLLQSFFEIIGLDKEEALKYAEQFVDMCYSEALKLALDKVNDQELGDIRERLAANQLSNVQAVEFVQSQVSAEEFGEILERVRKQRLEEMVGGLDIKLNDEQKKVMRLKLNNLLD